MASLASASVRQREGRMQEIMNLSRGTELPQPEPLAKMSVSSAGIPSLHPLPSGCGLGIGGSCPSALCTFVHPKSHALTRSPHSCTHILTRTHIHTPHSHTHSHTPHSHTRTHTLTHSLTHTHTPHSLHSLTHTHTALTALSHALARTSHTLTHHTHSHITLTHTSSPHVEGPPAERSSAAQIARGAHSRAR
jgi:hypothetical protein